MIGCHCEVCSSADPRDKRNRPSVLISYGATQVLIDATPELRLQCVAHGVDMVDALVVTHAHADHIMGLDDIRRFNFISGRPMDVWADADTMKKLQQCFGYAFLDPSVTTKVFRPQLRSRVIEGAFEIGGRTWQPVPLVHGDVERAGFPDRKTRLLHRCKLHPGGVVRSFTRCRGAGAGWLAVQETSNAFFSG